MSELHRRLKLAMARELVDMGYMAGVEVHREEGGIVDVQGKKGNEVNIEVWNTYLPEWTIVRIREVIEPVPSAIQEEYGVIHTKSNSEISMLKIFMEVFDGLSGQDKNDVEEKNFINELAKTGKFTKEEARTFIKKAMQNGQIYYHKPGFYVRA